MGKPRRQSSVLASRHEPSTDGGRECKQLCGLVPLYRQTHDAVNSRAIIRELELPARFSRPFSLHLYWVSHGLLLLRSGQQTKNDCRVDILFQDVVWMALPTWWDSLEISSSSIDAISFRLPAALQSEIQLRRVFRLNTDGTAHFVVAGRAGIAQDYRSYFEGSPLLPGLHVTEEFPSAGTSTNTLPSGA